MLSFVTIGGLLRIVAGGLTLVLGVVVIGNALVIHDAIVALFGVFFVWLGLTLALMKEQA